MSQPFYKSRKAKIKIMDECSYLVAFAGPFMTIPQVLSIWVERKVEGLSLITWSSYIILTFFWLYYGILHKEKPVIFSNVLGLIVNFIIVGGILAFKQ